VVPLPVRSAVEKVLVNHQINLGIHGKLETGVPRRNLEQA
jgi:hypothetical protein